MSEEIVEVNEEMPAEAEVKTETGNKEVENNPAFFSRDNFYSRINVSVKFMDRLIFMLIAALVILLFIGLFVYK